VSIRFLRLAIVWLLLLVTIWVVQPYATALWFSASAPRTVTPRADLAASEQATVRVFKEASASVVHVFARGTPAAHPSFPTSRKARCNLARALYGTSPAT
jgi:2-alkenal reductase